MPGVTVVASLDDALTVAGDVPEVCIIGGAEIYRLALPRTDLIHLTRVHAVVDADTYFPELGADEWDELLIEKHAADEKHTYAYSCVELRRRHPADDAHFSRRGSDSRARQRLIDRVDQHAGSRMPSRVATALRPYDVRRKSGSTSRS